ncbi:MAG: class I SAM-dependent methyltransferase, partial [Flavobacteriaceae bacterium]|nr:class I SAM-dependent methyltransferase [Flavobacteriaceae bacterium]
SQYGNCFFAACQMSKMLNNSIECIAIDTWSGDEHTGKYQDDVFNQFLYILHRNFPGGKYIRKLFTDALPQFEDGSIDLLHIDGLHTYKAVAEDFYSWLPKLSDRGIVMFHDTQVQERDFGVWRLWAELEAMYPSFEFEHSHGLGILLVGKNASAKVNKLFELFTKPDYVRLVNFFFSSLGKISPIQ